MKPVSVLVAEDNAMNFELVHDLLDALGHTVQWARDGEEALALAHTVASTCSCSTSTCHA